MKRVQKNSSIRIKPYKFVSGGAVLFYTTNQFFGTSFTEVYVPDNSIDLYRTAYNYNIPSGMIKPLSQYTKGIYNAT